MSSRETLEQAATIFKEGTKQYRDRLLETGRLLHQFVFEWLKEGIGTPRKKRIRESCTRREATDTAANRLGTTKSRINDMIAVSMFVDSVGISDLGELSYSVIRRFVPFMERVRGKGGEEVKDPTVYETWRIKKGLEVKACKAFRQAIKEHWTEQIVAANIPKLIPDDRLTTHRARTIIASQRREKEKAYDASTMLKNCSVGDAVDYLIDLINNSADPSNLSALLLSRLSKKLAC